MSNPLPTTAEWADRTLAYYAVHVTQSLADEPENASLRDSPETVRSFAAGILADLRTLCDIIELPWAQVVADAERAYREHCAGLPPLSADNVE